jgi:uncharacterized protein
MSKTVLITGGSGLVGKRLTEVLMQSGVQVRWLSRKPSNNTPVPSFEWHPGQKQMDEHALDGVDVVVNLAGKSLMDGPWKADSKQAFLQSRLDALETLGHHWNGRTPYLISASAIGFYGTAADAFEVDEQSPPGHDFLAKLCVQWEEMAHQVAPAALAIARVGVVLDPRGGALPQMAKPIQWFAGAVPGKGTQGLSWVHHSDISRAFCFLMDRELTGIYNFTGPKPVDLHRFMKTLAEVMRKPLWPMHVPPSLMRVALGEKADLVTEGAFVYPKALLQAGFKFQFPDHASALSALY